MIYSMFQNAYASLRDMGLVAYYGTNTLLYLTWTLLTQGPSALWVRPRDRPDVLDDPQLGTHHFAQLQDTRLHYVASGPEGSPLILFIHGYPEFWYSWRHQIKAFKKDYRVVAFDMRGYSESEKPHGVSSYSPDKLVADIKQLILHLGYRKCVLVSHDWGGTLAFMVASKYSDMVDKLVSCNSPHPSALVKLLATSAEQRKKSWYFYMFRWPVLPIIATRARDFEAMNKRRKDIKGAVTEEDMDAYKFTFQHYGDMTGPVNYYRAMTKYPSKDPDFRRKLQMPVLMIWGTNDLALSVELSIMSRKYCSDYTLKHIEGGSHWIQQEEPELVNEHIRDFLKQKPTAKLSKL